MTSYAILFVCLGNICRSPTAENIMKKLVAEAGLTESIFCDSAGTSNYHIGAPPDRRMTEAAKLRGIELIGKARQFEVADFQAFDLILAMDRSNYQDILYLDPQGKYRDKVQLMCDFATKYSVKDVPDPYYGGREGFELVIDLLLDSCQNLLKTLQKSGNLP